MPRDSVSEMQAAQARAEAQARYYAASLSQKHFEATVGRCWVKVNGLGSVLDLDVGDPEINAEVIAALVEGLKQASTYAGRHVP